VRKDYNLFLNKDMKKKVFGRKLSREKDTRLALFRSLMRALVLNGKIKTTKAKAKAIQKSLEKLINLAKKGTLAARRRVYSRLGNDRKTADLIFGTILPAFSAKKSGFTRIINLPERRGDLAKMVRLEWSEEIKKKDESIEKAKKSRSKDSKKGNEKKVKSVEKQQKRTIKDILKGKEKT